MDGLARGGRRSRGDLAPRCLREAGRIQDAVGRPGPGAPALGGPDGPQVANSGQALAETGKVE
jgi:hypothetical protein